VKVVITEDEELRNRVVRASNLQTAIPPSSFRAADLRQRDIEDFLLSRGWFYDRRKNHHRNMGKPPSRIIGINYLAQAVSAMALQEPDASRGQVSMLVKDDRTYRRIFADAHPAELFHFCASTMKAVDRYAGQSDEWPDEVRKKLRYHAATLLVARQLPKPQSTPIDLTSIFAWTPSDPDLRGAFSQVVESFTRYSRQTGQSLDPASKSQRFTQYLMVEGGYRRATAAREAATPARATEASTRSGRPYSRRASTLEELLERAATLHVDGAIKQFVERATHEWGFHTRVHYSCVNLNAPAMKSVGLVILGSTRGKPGMITVETAAKSFARFYPSRTETEYRTLLGPARQELNAAQLEDLAERIAKLFSDRSGS